MSRKGREKVVAILMRRDGLSREDAVITLEDAMSEVYDAIDGTSCLDPEEVWMEETGLEPDYLMDLIF